MSHYN